MTKHKYKSYKKLYGKKQCLNAFKYLTPLEIQIDDLLKQGYTKQTITETTGWTMNQISATLNNARRKIENHAK